MVNSTHIAPESTKNKKKYLSLLLQFLSLSWLRSLQRIFWTKTDQYVWDLQLIHPSINVQFVKQYRDPCFHPKVAGMKPAAWEIDHFLSELTAFVLTPCGREWNCRSNNQQSFFSVSVCVVSEYRFLDDEWNVFTGHFVLSCSRLLDLKNKWLRFQCKCWHISINLVCFTISKVYAKTLHFVGVYSEVNKGRKSHGKYVFEDRELERRPHMTFPAWYRTQPSRRGGLFKPLTSQLI